MRVEALVNAIAPQESPAPSPLKHKLGAHFDALAQFNSTGALQASALYAALRDEIERVLGSVVQEDFADALAQSDAAPPGSSYQIPVAPQRASGAGAIRATAWNIERGTRFEGIVRTLGEHPLLSRSDVLLLTELDYGMARSSNRFVAREMAESLGFNYVFAPCYLALNKGSGLESEVAGENTQALHGNALLSRYPLRGAHSLALPNGKDKMRGKEKRLGCQRAVVADVEHPSGKFRAVSLHLDAHSTQSHRHRQMKLVLDHLETLKPRSLPVLIGGDWNTTTYNSRHAIYAIGGFFRRVLMGVHHVIRNHYVHPERWFERQLFDELERRGYLYRELNEPDAGTLHYDVADLAVNVQMRDWIPQWCFWFINWALKENGGRCSLKLDWFAGRRLEADPREPPRVVGQLRDAVGPLSDHDPIVLDFFSAKR